MLIPPQSKSIDYCTQLVLLISIILNLTYWLVIDCPLIAYSPLITYWLPIDCLFTAILIIYTHSTLCGVTLLYIFTYSHTYILYVLIPSSAGLLGQCCTPQGPVVHTQSIRSSSSLCLVWTESRLGPTYISIFLYTYISISLYLHTYIYIYIYEFGVVVVCVCVCSVYSGYNIGQHSMA